MNVLLAVLTPIALVNSVPKLPSGIAGVIASLGTPKPTLTASAFIAGMFVPHFTFGLLLVLGLETAIDQVNVWMQDMWRRPDPLIGALQLVIGAVMVAVRLPPVPCYPTPTRYRVVDADDPGSSILRCCRLNNHWVTGRPAEPA